MEPNDLPEKSYLMNIGSLDSSGFVGAESSKFQTAIFCHEGKHIPIFFAHMDDISKGKEELDEWKKPRCFPDVSGKHTLGKCPYHWNNSSGGLYCNNPLSFDSEYCEIHKLTKVTPDRCKLVLKLSS